MTKPVAAGLIAAPSLAPKAARMGFAASLLGRAPGTAGDATVPPSLVAGAAAPGAALSLKKPTLSARLTGLPSPAAALMGRAPGVAPSLPQQNLTFGLTRADLRPLSVGQGIPRLPAPAGPLGAAALAGQPATAPPMSSAVMAPRLSAIAGVPRLQAAMQSAALAPKYEVPGAPQLQGVDLRLDNFDLSSVKRVSLEATEGCWGGEAQSLDRCVSVGEAFWSSLADETGPFQGDDRALLQKIFNVELADRRMEGDRFVPPDATYSYVQQLRTLVKDEEKVREMRKEHFFSKAFTFTQPGPLFPASWSSGCAIARDGAPARLLAERPQGSLHERPEYKGEAAAVLLHILKGSTPVFDNRTEEGLRFRIYQIGTLEVRTIEAAGGEEKVGVVFSFRTPTPRGGRKGSRIQEHEKITRATEYVEHAPPSASHAGSAFPCQYYLVLETESGHKIATERRMDGAVTWEEDPEDLEDRNSLAKVTRTKAAGVDLTVRDMMAYHTTIINGSASGSVTRSVCKRYTRNLFSRAVASSSGQVPLMPVRSARLAAQARKAGRPPCWADIAMGSA